MISQVVTIIIALSTVGNILAVLFTTGRGIYPTILSPLITRFDHPLAVVQELAREGVLPFSALFSSNKPFNAPFMGLFEQWFITTLLVLFVPSGDAFIFMLSRAYPDRCRSGFWLDRWLILWMILQ